MTFMRQIIHLVLRQFFSPPNNITEKGKRKRWAIVSFIFGVNIKINVHLYYFLKHRYVVFQDLSTSPENKTQSAEFVKVSEPYDILLTLLQKSKWELHSKTISCLQMKSRRWVSSPGFPCNVQLIYHDMLVTNLLTNEACRVCLINIWEVLWLPWVTSILKKKLAVVL